MEWWTHLWLNEGFATWIEYLCVDHTHPEFEIWTNFPSREYASAPSLDIATSKNPAAIKFVLDSRLTTVTVEGVGPDDWILVCNIKLLSTGGVLCRDAH